MAGNYETKDSGNRQTFDSGMQRDTADDKTDWSLVYDGPMLERYAELMTRGARKYSARNWMKAAGQAELDRFRSSAARHFAQWLRGDDDEDHAAAVVFNLNGAEYVMEKLNQTEVFDHTHNEDCLVGPCHDPTSYPTFEGEEGDLGHLGAYQ